jgi:vacuolar-type H+-ATPase subunit E/Vma4
VLAAQHGFVERVFARAEALAATGAADARFLDALPHTLEALAAHLGGEPATLRCRGDLAAVLQQRAADLRGIEVVADAAAPAGFVVRTRDGRCTIDCSLPSRLAALRPRVQAALLERVIR